MADPMQPVVLPNLSEEMERLGLSAAQLAAAAGLTDRTIRAAARGDRPVRRKTAERIRKALIAVSGDGASIPSGSRGEIKNPPRYTRGIGQNKQSATKKLHFKRIQKRQNSDLKIEPFRIFI